MDLQDIVVPTGVVKQGMTVGHALKECVRCNVPGIPFIAEDGQVTGRFSIRHLMKSACIPRYMVKAAHLLGDQIGNATMMPVQVRAILDRPVGSFILENTAVVSPVSPVDKALAIMEQANSSYIFLMEGDKYIGVVTRMGIAALMLEHQDESI